MKSIVIMSQKFGMALFAFCLMAVAPLGIWAGSSFSATGGDADWSVEADGSWRSGPITDGETSWMEIAVTNAPCVVSFKWKTSSEEDCDELHCYLDGKESVTALSGEMGEWNGTSFVVAESGDHVVRFAYTKDVSYKEGEDCGWVKDFATSAGEPHTLLLNANDGRSEPTTKLVIDGYAIGALPVPVWGGEGTWRFLGWFTAAEGGDAVTLHTVVSAGWEALYAHWAELHPPANDDFSNAAAISGASGSVEGTTVDSTRERPDLIPDRYNSSYSSTVWYKWTAPSSGKFAFSAVDADSESGRSCCVAATRGYDDDEGRWLDASIAWGRVVVSATAGDVYWIEVGSSYSVGFDFTLSWSEREAPANDDFANAAAISGASGSVDGTTVDSTRESEDLIPGGYASSYSSTVWYKWTAPSSGKFVFSAVDADPERDESCCVAATRGYDDDEGRWLDAAVAWGRVVVSATAGDVYWIEVGSYYDADVNEEVDFVLSWRKMEAPANDDFANAAAISGASGSVEGTTVDSMRESPDLIPDWYDEDFATVWYKWTAPSSGKFAFSAVDADSKKGWSCYVAATKGYDDDEGRWSDASVAWGSVEVSATAGDVYWIEVGSYGESDFALSWREMEPPANDDFANAAAISGASGSVEGTTVDSTRESPDLIPDRYDEDFATVWYKWTAPSSGKFSFSVSVADAGPESGDCDACADTSVVLCGVAATRGYDDDEGRWLDAAVAWGRVVVSATAGDVYWIEVGSGYYDFTLSWREMEPPANDDFANAAAISGASGSVDGTTVDGTREYPDLIPDWYDEDFATVWYKWTAPSSGKFSFSASVVDAGPESGDCDACADPVSVSCCVAATKGYDDDEGLWSDAAVTWGGRVVVSATAGDVYWIEVGSYHEAGENGDVDFVLSWREMEPPANDDFANAAAISGASGSVDGTTVDGTREYPDLIPDRYFKDCSTVWYKWAAPSSGKFVFSVANTDRERGESCYVAATRSYDDEGRWDDAAVARGRVVIDAMAGDVYWIEVGSSYSVGFDFTLSWRELELPANDDFANAAVIEGEAGMLEATNIGATVEEGENIVNVPESTIWYKWTAPTNGIMTIDAISDFDMVIGVYTGSGLDDLQCIATKCSWWSDPQVEFAAEEGVSYFIVVGGSSSATGIIDLNWDLFSGFEMKVDGNGVVVGCRGICPAVLMAEDWPDGVTSIGEDAFSGCSGLTSVTIPDSVTSIGDGAFGGCSGLTSVTIPDSVTSIGDGAFGGCSGLADDDGFIIVMGVLYGYVGDATSVTIPDSVTRIGGWAFSNCDDLTSVTILDSVTSIGVGAFYGCSGLADDDGFIIVRDVLYGYIGDATSVTIPDGVTSIGFFAFSDCSGLASVTIPDGVTSIGSFAFYGCSDALFDTATIAGAMLVDGWAVGNTGSLSGDLDLTGVRGVGGCAFEDCSGLTSVTIGNGVTSIGDYAFADCDGLTNVTFMGNAPAIGEEAFYGVDGCVVRVPRDSTGWGVSIPGTWNGLQIEYIEGEEPATYMVTYAPGANGTGSEQTATKTEDVALELAGAMFTRDGYTQTGWATSDGGAKAYDLGASYAANADLTLYPFWTANNYKLTPNNAKHGTVTGGGTYPVDGKATLKATAKKGYVFAGWFTDEACTKPLDPEGYDPRNPKVKIAMPANDTTVYAKFVTKAEAKKSLKFPSATKKLAKTPAKATAGAAISLKIGVSSDTLPTITAKGLPKGLKIDKTTGELTGAATKPGSYTATVTVKDAAGNKITQKVKITVNAPSWAKGTFYGTMKPGKKGDPAAYLQFTVAKTGKVSGKVTYKGKAYSFKSTYKSCTASKATFAPKVKIGKKTFKLGTVTVKEEALDGLGLVEVSNAKGTFAAQKKPNLVKKGKALAELVGMSFTFTKKSANSGLKKAKDKLSVKLSNGDAAKVTGTVNGKRLSASLPLLVSGKETADGVTTYTLYVDIIEPSLKYERTLVVTATVDAAGRVSASAAFAK